LLNKTAYDIAKTETMRGEKKEEAKRGPSTAVGMTGWGREGHSQESNVKEKAQA
jgi:hypothetical protein